jgi:beta-phosphoglucomutase
MWYDPLQVLVVPICLDGLALIFDLDGVIVDSNPVHVKVWRAYLEHYGIDPGDSLPARMYGRRNDDIVRDFFGSHLSREKVLAHGAAKEALYRQAVKPQLGERLVPGAATFLERHRGMPMGLATNAEPANAEFILRESGLRGYFSVVMDGHQVERPKPDTEIYVRTAQLLATDPRNCVVFEDSSAGVKAARDAGARVVALRTTHLSLPMADLAVDDFLSPELEPWLGRQSVQR